MTRSHGPGSAGRRPRLARAARVTVAAALAVAGVAVAVPPFGGAGRARADEVTISANDLRDGWDSGETTGTLTPATLKGGTFGQLFATGVDGQVYAQPIVAGGTVVVATENDEVYGLSAATGAIKWSTSLGTPFPASAEHCTDLAPNVGVTGTPVYDPGTGLVYMVSEVIPAGHTGQQPAFYMNALNVSDGSQAPGWPVAIKGAPTNDPSVPFTPFTQLQRPGLLLLGGSVYAAFGSHCDFTPYDGYVVGVNASSKQQTMWSDEAGLTDTQAGIWQSGGGLASDGSGRIFFASGNGVSPAPGPGTKPPSELAESVVRLAVLKDGSLAAKDFFSPANAPYLDSIDGDLGAGSPVGLPFGTTALPHLLVIAGKVDGLFVLNRDSLGGREQGPGKGDAAVSETGKGLPGEWGHPAAFADTPVLAKGNLGHDYVYYVGKNDALRYFKAVLGGPQGVTPMLADVAQSSQTFGYTSGSPVVTSDGTDRTTGVVWAVNSSDSTGTTGTLEAFPAVPPGTCSSAKPCSVAPIWTSAPFSGAGKFTTPATDGGRVFIATRGVVSDGSNCGAVPSGDYCGEVLGFGSPSRAPLGGASPVNFGDVAVGSSSAPQDVTVSDTSSGAVTVNSVSVAGTQFATAGTYEVNGVPMSLPQTLNPGDTLTAQGVSFNPAAPGGAAGSLEFNTSSVNFPSVGVSLSGTGTQNGFFASASTVSFGTSVPVGTATQQQVTVTNTESVALTLTSATLPSAPFGVSGLPADGTVVQPGQSVPLTISYQPTGTGGDNDSLSLTGTDTGAVQTTTSITMSGTGAADIEPTLTATPAVSFGSVPLGHNAARFIGVTNSGNMPAVISVTKPPLIPFGAPDPIASGLPVNPGYDVEIPVTFDPVSVGAVSDSYQLTWTDANGSHTLSVPVSGTGTAAAGVAVPPPGGGWTFNGTAKMTAANLSLTRPVAGQAGSAVYSVPEPSDGLKATFTATLNGGTGADGMTLALLDASKAGQRAVGGSGALLGFGPLPGVAVTLDTRKDGAGYPSDSFVGIATGAQSGLLKFAATKNVPGLRTGSHVIGVSVAAGKITVTVDGTQVLSKAVTVPPTVRLAFTGATGGKTDNHLVSKASITAGGHRVPGPGGGWTYNGAATTSGSDTRLTSAAQNLAGSVVYAAPVRAVGLRTTFNVQLTGGTGGDGMTFALLNPNTTTARTLGGSGGFLGLGTSSGVPGLGVVLDTNGRASPAGFVGLSVNVGANGLRFQRKAQGIGVLTTGTHTVTVNVTKSRTLGPVVTVYLDGVQVLQRAEPGLTQTVRLAFTAGTGTTTDIHIVRNAAISAPS